MSMITLTLQSCCSMFEIFPLSPELIVAYVGHTTEEEKVYISEDGLKAPVILSNGDMWRSLNVLQSTKMALGREIKQTNVYGTLLQIWFCQHSGPDVESRPHHSLYKQYGVENSEEAGIIWYPFFVRRTDFPSSVQIHFIDQNGRHWVQTFCWHQWEEDSTEFLYCCF